MLITLICLLSVGTMFSMLLTQRERCRKGGVRCFIQYGIAEIYMSMFCIIPVLLLFLDSKGREDSTIRIIVASACFVTTLLGLYIGNLRAPVLKSSFLSCGYLIRWAFIGFLWPLIFLISSLLFDRSELLLFTPAPLLVGYWGYSGWRKFRLESTRPLFLTTDELVELWICRLAWLPSIYLGYFAVYDLNKKGHFFVIWPMLSVWAFTSGVSSVLFILGAKIWFLRRGKDIQSWHCAVLIGVIPLFYTVIPWGEFWIATAFGIRVRI